MSFADKTIPIYFNLRAKELLLNSSKPSMKKAFSVLLFFAAFHAQANDTLTRAQVYNFNVGDTFDYRIVMVNQTGQYTYNYTYSYERDVIISQWYASSLLNIVRHIHNTDVTVADGMDTFVLYNPQTYAFYADTGCAGGVITPVSYYTDSNSTYHNLLLNGNTQSCFESWSDQGYASGLGMVYFYYGNSYTGSDPLWWDSTYLIYYHKGTETWGTPYYDLPNAIQQLTATDDLISLFPTVSDGIFNINISDANLLPVKLFLYDMGGREMKQLSLDKLNNNVSIETCGAGVYIWKALSQGTFVQSGKMFVK